MKGVLSARLPGLNMLRLWMTLDDFGRPIATFMMGIAMANRKLADWSFLFTDWRFMIFFNEEWELPDEKWTSALVPEDLVTAPGALVLCGLASTALDGWVNADTRCYLGISWDRS